MSKLQADRTENAFEDYKAPYTTNQAMAEANRCLYCVDAPCIKACPTAIDIPEFIRKISTQNVQGSAKTIFDSNILGMSCSRVCPVEVLCVGDCVYNLMDVPPIQIGRLQRYSTDLAFENGWRYYEAGEATGKSVGLVGGGPASLAAAHELRRFGHACTIYDKSDILGGLNTNGVAPYKMKADRSIEEVEWILAIGGIDIQSGVTVGKDISWEDLEAKHDAIFVGVGLGPDRLLKATGEDLEGVHGAVEWIDSMKLGDVNLSHVKHALVIGGGNTAMDCVRELCGLGIENVHMVYRGDESRMSGYAHEWAAAKQLGAKAIWSALPLAYEGGTAVKTAHLQMLDDERKPIIADVLQVKADLVLLAVGQSKLGDDVKHLGGIETDWGRLVVDENQALGRKGWFAGGDASNGAKEVVNAAAEGKLAATSIDRYLKGGN
jgi:glutamate synthase (NADPH/NADH) small chain